MNENIQRTAIDLASVREKLAGKRGREYWRSLEEAAAAPEFRDYLENEFAPSVFGDKESVSRRRLLQLAGASLGLAGVTACTKQPPEKIVPYVDAPEDVVPGKPRYFATAIPLGGFASGVLVESHMGRPTKIEGNPEHPASLGGTDAFTQASILSLYDPERSRVVVRRGKIGSWVGFLGAVGRERQRFLTQQGAGLRILSETVTSPTLAGQMRRLLTQFPEAKWHQYEPVNRDSAREGSRLAFGEAANLVYGFDQADIVLSLDSDFLAVGPGSVRYARDFASRRRAAEGEAAEHSGMNRLYVVEPAPSLTGGMADHRLALTSREIERFALAVAAAVGVPGAAAPSGVPERWVKAVAADLRNHRGAGVVIAGDYQPPAVHALAHAMNHALGNAGNTVVYTDVVEANPVDQMASISELCEDMAAGKVETLVMLGGNPVYNAPVDLDFEDACRRVGLRIHLGYYDDETSALCHWHIPEAHPLETWGDIAAFDGTVTVQQPLIAPLYSGRSALELLSAWNGGESGEPHEIVRAYWRQRSGAEDFERFWRKSLHDGVIGGTMLPAKTLALRADIQFAAPPGDDGMELHLRPDPTVWDGRFANNGWLQELPKPLTKLTWGNAVLISPSTAERLDLVSEDVVEVSSGGRTMEAPVFISPGHADDCVTIHLGHGRTRGGDIARGVGSNAYHMRTAGSPWCVQALEIRKTGARHSLATTQAHHNMEGRNLVRVAPIEEFEEDHHVFHHGAHDPPPELTLYPGFPYEGYSWGMAIDLSSCTGCGACVVACQAENNIPVVGKAEVQRGRELHWIRIDRYYQGELDHPDIYHQPVTCMHCDGAPCEVVCPTGATVHSAEGLNQMTYNRCVGTRYCSNNCPYKVRRFNFYQYSDWTSASLKLLRNPDVTVRTRGVMEKCTYCVQRINVARIEAKKEDRAIRDGEVVTACQAACPSQAIAFGNLNDPQSRVAKLKNDPRNYGILTELNTRPRTTYLGRLRNANPELDEA